MPLPLNFFQCFTPRDRVKVFMESQGVGVRVFIRDGCIIKFEAFGTMETPESVVTRVMADPGAKITVEEDYARHTSELQRPIGDFLLHVAQTMDEGSPLHLNRSLRPQFGFVNRMLGFFSIPLGGGRIGRDHQCEIFIPESSISHLHAVVEWRPSLVEGQENEVWIKDAFSTNGTFVNGDRAKETQLNDGDSVLFGYVEFLFLRAGRPKPVNLPVSYDTKILEWSDAQEEGSPTRILAE